MTGGGSPPHDPSAGTQVELDDDERGVASGNIGEDTTAEMTGGVLVVPTPPLPPVEAPSTGGGGDGAPKPFQRVDMTIPIVDKTIAADTAQTLAPAPEGELSLEQYAWLYACQMAGPQEHAEALSEAGLTAEQYAAWRMHWESRMMHNPDERTRWFTLVAKLRG